jgi:hypothetical protein
MSERPILFSAPMVRAILAGQKTQTRRVVTGRGWDQSDYKSVRLLRSDDPRLGLQAFFFPGHLGVKCAFGAPGDRLWVRETWSPDHRDVYPCVTTVYRADCGFTDAEAREHRHCNYERTGMRHFECLACAGFKWRPSIFMKRQLSRITLEVTDVRVERLQEISGEDCAAEGIGAYPHLETRKNFSALWDSINSKRASWDSNPWVWVVSFKRVEQA